MRISTLGFAVLGLLARRERTGYQIAASLKRPVGYFWSAGHSQIYPELHRLEQLSLVQHVVVDGPGPRDTKRYAITDAGRQALSEWVVRPPAAVESPRDELLLKVYSCWLADRGAVIDMVRGERQRNLELLERYSELREEHETVWAEQIRDPATAEFGSYATLRRGLDHQRHVLSWFDWLLGVLQDAAPARPGRASPRDSSPGTPGP